MIAKLKIPPGMARPGTKYDARGRWYDGLLVRWVEGVLQPWGGWEPLTRTADIAVDAAIHEDNVGAFTNETTDANSAAAGDVTLAGTSSAKFYIGHKFRFSAVSIIVSDVTASSIYAWEYWNGSAWVSLTDIVDGTVGFTVSGLNTVSFSVPNDWAKNTVNSQGPFYYIRARAISLADTVTGSQVFIADGPLDVDEPVRGMFAWRPNSQTPHVILGTPTKAYVFGGGVLLDVTPAGFATGGADASLASGQFGAGAFGVGPFGTGDAGQASLTEANTWQFDNFDEDIVGLAHSDGKIYLWDTSAGGLMAQLSGSPTSCKGVVVTPEGFVVALGAGGDGRRLQWCDRRQPTVWTPAISNQAGSINVPGKGQLMAGRRGKDETLIWTDVDFFVMVYVNPQLVYRVPQRGSKCGPISRMAMDVVDGKAFWMGKRTFFVYDGFVRPLACELADAVFDDFNTLQASKVTCGIRSDYGAVRWHYPSANSTENDRYVEYNYRENHWHMGSLQRTSIVDRDAFPNALGADAKGTVYSEGIGAQYLDHNGVALVPFIESGPVEIGDGQNVMDVLSYIPDEKTLGDTQLFLYVSNYPTEGETLVGPFPIGSLANFRTSGRWVRLRIQQVRPGWRFGTPRLEGELGGER